MSEAGQSYEAALMQHKHMFHGSTVTTKSTHSEATPKKSKAMVLLQTIALPPLALMQS
jgi:acyl dehydratase